MSNVLTLEQELELKEIKNDSVTKRNPRVGKVAADDDEAIEKARKKEAAKNIKITKYQAGEDEKKSNSVNNNDRLNNDAISKLNYYLRKTPHFQIIDKQISVLQEERLVYKANGSTDNVSKCDQILKELIEKRSQIKSIFRTGNSNKEKDKEAVKEKFRNSEKLAVLIQKQKELQKSIEKLTPSWWIKKLDNYRKQIKLKDELSSITEPVDDLDVILDTNKKIIVTDLYQDYYNFCGEIADILDLATDEIVEMKLGTLRKMLNETLDDSSELKDELNRTKMVISSEREILSGGTNLTDIVFEIFDFKSDEDDVLGSQTREIIASAYIGLVKSIAYNMTAKLGIQKYFEDDAVSYGLLGLTVAINKWYSLQKSADSALSFKGFANQYISMNIQRGLYEIQSGGDASGSTIATLATKSKQKIENFIKYNPEFADFDKTLLNNILAGYDGTDAPLDIVKESDYVHSVGGEEGDGDIWANATVSNDSTSDYVEAKIEYENLLKSIKELLNLFETKVDKNTGIKKITGRKMFDKYDRKLFMMYFGLEFKRQKTAGSKDALYTQEEMGLELQAMYAADGINKTFSQASLSGKDGRIAVLLNKIKSAMEHNPKLKSGFEYLYNYWLENVENMNLMSNNREEIGMRNDRDELREIYSNNEAELNRQLSDGKKLSEVFQISDTNPLDDEIASLFDEE